MSGGDTGWWWWGEGAGREGEARAWLLLLLPVRQALVRGVTLWALLYGMGCTWQMLASKQSGIGRVVTQNVTVVAPGPGRVAFPPAAHSQPAAGGAQAVATVKPGSCRHTLATRRPALAAATCSNNNPQGLAVVSARCYSLGECDQLAHAAIALRWPATRRGCACRHDLNRAQRRCCRTPAAAAHSISRVCGSHRSDTRHACSQCGCALLLLLLLKGRRQRRSIWRSAAHRCLHSAPAGPGAWPTRRSRRWRGCRQVAPAAQHPTHRGVAAAAAGRPATVAAARAASARRCRAAWRRGCRRLSWRRPANSTLVRRAMSCCAACCSWLHSRRLSACRVCLRRPCRPVGGRRR